MINSCDYEETFTQLGVTQDEANEVIRFFEVLAQIVIDNNIEKPKDNE
jgi:hypothetical protein